MDISGSDGGRGGDGLGLERAGVDHTGDAAFGIFPKIELAVLFEKIGWRHGRARAQGDRALDLVQPVHAEPRVETGLLKVEIFEVVGETARLEIDRPAA